VDSKSNLFLSPKISQAQQDSLLEFEIFFGKDNEKSTICEQSNAKPRLYSAAKSIN